MGEGGEGDGEDAASGACGGVRVLCEGGGEADEGAGEGGEDGREVEDAGAEAGLREVG